MSEVLKKLNKEPDVFDAANLLAQIFKGKEDVQKKALLDYEEIKTTAEKQRNEGKLWSPELTMMRLIGGFDGHGELDSLLLELGKNLEN